MPRGNSAWLHCQTSAKSAGRPPIGRSAGSRRPGPEAIARPPESPTCRIASPILRVPHGCRRAKLQDPAATGPARNQRSGASRMVRRSESHPVAAGATEGRATAACRGRPASAAPRRSRAPAARAGSAERRPCAASPDAPSHRAPRGRRLCVADRVGKQQRELPLMSACSAWRRTARGSRRPSRRCRRAGLLHRGEWFDDLLPGRCSRRVLQQCVQQRRQFRLPLIAAGDVGVADRPGVGAHGAARDRHLAQVEWAPPPPMRPRTITRPASGPRSRGIRQRAMASLSSAASVRASTAIQRRRAACGGSGGTASGMAAPRACSDV